MMALARTLHVLAAVIWVGGMFFAWFALRPSVTELDPDTRARLWRDVLQRFFTWVWVAIVVLALTGYWMLFAMGGFSGAGVHVHIMNLLGLIMIAIFLHAWFAPYQRLRRAVSAANSPWASEQLHQIRLLVGINLSIGIIVIVVASGLRYLI